MSDDRIDPWLEEPSEYPRAVFRGEYRACHICTRKLEGPIKSFGLFAVHKSCLDEKLRGPDPRPHLRDEMIDLVNGMSDEQLRSLRDFARELTDGSGDPTT